MLIEIYFFKFIQSFTLKTMHGLFSMFYILSGFLVGGYFSLSRKDPLIGLTVAWALHALSSKTRYDCDVKNIPDNSRLFLSQLESTLSKVLIGTSVVSPLLPKMF